VKVEFPVGENLGFVDFGGDVNQRRLIGSILQMPVDRVVAKIGFTADKPLYKRWFGIVEDFLGRFVPMNPFGLRAPKTFGIFVGMAMKFFMGSHARPPGWRFKRRRLLVSFGKCSLLVGIFL